MRRMLLLVLFIIVSILFSNSRLSHCNGKYAVPTLLNLGICTKEGKSERRTSSREAEKLVQTT